MDTVHQANYKIYPICTSRITEKQASVLLRQSVLFTDNPAGLCVLGLPVTCSHRLPSVTVDMS